MRTETQKKLEVFLGALPKDKARSLATAIEYDRIAGGRMEHGIVLRSLRPVLQKAGGPRPGTASPLRLFCQPLEEFLVADHARNKGVGQISRASLTPLWEWLANDLMPEKHNVFSARLVRYILAKDDEAIAETLADLHQMASRVIASAYDGVDDDSRDFLKFVDRFGEIDIAKDIREVGRILEVAPHLMRLQNRLDRRIEDLSDQDILAAKAVYDEVAKERPDMAAYVPLAVKPKLAKPWQIIGVLAALSRAPDDRMIQKTDIGFVGDLVFDELEELAALVNAHQIIETESEDVIEALRRFADISRGVTREYKLHRDGAWGQRLFAARKVVAQSLDRQIKRFPDYVVKALPVLQMGAFGGQGALRPDMSKAPDGYHAERALRFAEFMDNSRFLAADGAFGNSHQQAMEQAQSFLQIYGDDLISEVRAANASSLDRLQEHLQVTIALVRYIAGDDEADLLQKRAVVASQTAEEQAS